MTQVSSVRPIPICLGTDTQYISMESIHAAVERLWIRCLGYPVSAETPIPFRRLKYFGSSKFPKTLVTIKVSTKPA
ncbi:MAG: hypothetical protein JW384_03982 [Nitrosomonadaceae bacterium]|nr:hypothetical protein [Nitrosomonadaceae bacterium]